MKGTTQIKFSIIITKWKLLLIFIVSQFFDPNNIKTLVSNNIPYTKQFCQDINTITKQYGHVSALFRSVLIQPVTSIIMLDKLLLHLTNGWNSLTRSYTEGSPASKKEVKLGAELLTEQNFHSCHVETGSILMTKDLRENKTNSLSVCKSTFGQQTRICNKQN